MQVKPIPGLWKTQKTLIINRMHVVILYKMQGS